MAKAKKIRKDTKAPKMKISPQASLAAFMKRVWRKPDLMEKFASGREGREQVLENSILSAKHAELVRKGCVRDIMAALAGTSSTYDTITSNINAADVVQCGHAECNAFMAALKPTKATDSQS